MSIEKSLPPPIQQREQYYIKRGKKYYPVNDPGAYDGLSKGAWLVTVNKGCTSIRTAIDIKNIKLEAALKYLEDELCNAISEASKMRPSSYPISDKERKAWKAFEKIMGKDMPKYCEYPSNQEIANKGCQYLKKIMLENNCDIDTIKEKYEVKKISRNSISDLEI